MTNSAWPASLSGYGQGSSIHRYRFELNRRVVFTDNHGLTQRVVIEYGELEFVASGQNIWNIEPAVLAGRHYRHAVDADNSVHRLPGSRGNQLAMQVSDRRDGARRPAPGG